MNFDEIQNAWNSPSNNLPTEQQRQLAERFTRQMKRRRRFQILWLANTFVSLTVITALAIRTIAAGKVQPAQEWGLFPLLIIPWAFAIYFLRQHRKASAATKSGELSVFDAFRAALTSNRSSQSHLRWIGALYVIVIPVLMLTMRQLHQVGKVSERELTSMAAFFGIALLAGGTGIALRYFAALRPQEKKLDALLAEMTRAGS
jgi:hypothetical protein